MSFMHHDSILAAFRASTQWEHADLMLSLWRQQYHEWNLLYLLRMQDAKHRQSQTQSAFDFVRQEELMQNSISP